MKRSDLFFIAILIPVDIAMVVLAFLAAYYLRLGQGDASVIANAWPLPQYLTFVGTLTPFWLPIFAIVGLYSPKKLRRFWEELAAIFVGVAGGTFLVIAWPFLTRQEFFSRLVVIYLFIFALLFVTIGRLGIRMLRDFLHGFGVGVRRVVLIGKSEFTKAIRDGLNQRSGYEVTSEVTTLAALHKLPRTSFDALFVTDPTLPEEIALDFIEFADQEHLEFQFVPNLFHARASHIEPVIIAGIPVFRLRRTRLDEWGRITKRLLDIALAGIGLVVASPIMALVAVAIRIESPGPAVFRQSRVGSGGRLFKIMKFRSMSSAFAKEKTRAEELAEYQKLDAKKVQEVAQHIFYQKADDDPRITRIGKFIRKTNLDELPQLWNVLRGEMSLVGPRPLRAEEFEQVSTYEKSYYWVYHVKPGLTGLWQVTGRSELTDQERIQLDLDYVENWSLGRDLWIITRTAINMLFSRKGAR